MNLESKTANPYVGLRPFEQEDSLYFFGRRELTAALLDQLHRSRFLAVVGSSGCGKNAYSKASLQSYFRSLFPYPVYTRLNAFRCIGYLYIQHQKIRI